LKISAKDIERWAETREAQGELPRLIRRLAVQAGTVTEIAFPAGDSVSRPGLDGLILSKAISVNKHTAWLVFSPAFGVATAGT